MNGVGRVRYSIGDEWGLARWWNRDANVSTLYKETNFIDCVVSNVSIRVETFITWVYIALETWIC